MPENKHACFFSRIETLLLLRMFSKRKSVCMPTACLKTQTQARVCWCRLVTRLTFESYEATNLT